MLPERTKPLIIVAAAIISADRLLACARARPPALAGYWELPGGKVEPGESEPAALMRECREELAVQVSVGERVADDVPVTGGDALLRVYLARLVGDAQPQPLDHAELRWLSTDTLDSVRWLPADLPVVAALRPILGAVPTQP